MNVIMMVVDDGSRESKHLGKFWIEANWSLKCVNSPRNIISNFPKTTNYTPQHSRLQTWRMDAKGVGHVVFSKELVIPPETPLLNFTHLLVYASSSLAEQTTPASFWMWWKGGRERKSYKVQKIQLDSMNSMDFGVSKELWVVPLSCFPKLSS